MQTLKLKTMLRDRRRIVFFFRFMDRPFAQEIVEMIDTPQRGRPRRSYPAALYYAARIRLALPKVDAIGREAPGIAWCAIMGAAIAAAALASLPN